MLIKINFSKTSKNLKEMIQLAMPKLMIGYDDNAFELEVPIFQGGMGVGLSLSGLASAVANEGGAGTISAPGIGMYEPDFHENFIGANSRALRKELIRAHELTDGVVGVNILTPQTNYKEAVQVALEEGAHFIAAGASLPLDLAELVGDNTKTKLIPIISSERALRLICRSWKRYNRVPDAVIVEGPKAGGHLGFSPKELANPDYYCLEEIIPRIVDEVKKQGVDIPIIAAGGIYTGADIRNIMCLGASGVQMGTRFVTTDVCEAPPEFKNVYLAAEKEDIEVFESPLGLQGRAIKNDFLEQAMAGKKRPKKCFKCINGCAGVGIKGKTEEESINPAPYCYYLALINAKKGKLKNGFAFAGVNAYRAKETGIISVHELFQILKREYDEAAASAIG